MESIDVGFISILPPLIAIVLALLTKEVISSLVVGILSGTFIYTIHTGGSATAMFSNTIALLSGKLADNADIIIFLSLLGALVAVVTLAGGSRSYGQWAAKRLKNRKGAQAATSGLGLLIFVDDYFNCLTVGTVMQPVTDRYDVSRVKLAYLIDATAAPVCIIAPISSWAASVISQMGNTGLDGMSAFVSSIPYNLYALLTIAMVFVISLFKCDFGPMARFERKALKDHDLHARPAGELEVSGGELSTLQPSAKGRVLDLAAPIITLIVLCVLAMLYVGGYFEGGMTLAEGFGETDAGPALALGAFATLILTFIYFMIRRVVGFRDYMRAIGVGMKSMVPAFIILCLAWTISGVCRDLLNTGPYVGDLVQNSAMPMGMIPAIIFIVAGLLSFSTGTSWGTFGILIPIVALVCEQAAPELMIIALAATLAGSVLGDHCSPISDTTILSSAGAGCHHIDHVTTQMPYAITVGLCCLIGYIIAGFTTNLLLTLVVSFGLLGLALVFLPRIWTGESKRKKG
ncbi:MAG: Na+/H+ antiporter NhaC family protein [Clostridiales bacterium]|nr:Na+/H+ antiporter NhaC family protein [Clostridiales bacterium]